MNWRLGALTILVTAVSVVGSSCSSTSPSSSSFFKWAVDTRSYQAAPLGLTYANQSQNTFAGFVCSMGQSATVATPASSIPFHTGVYASPFTVSPASPLPSDAFQLVINEGLAAQTNGPVPTWVASAGTMTLTTVDGSHIVGSFDVTLVPNGNSSETGTAHGTGSFDVPPFTSSGNICGEVSGG